MKSNGKTKVIVNTMWVLMTAMLVHCRLPKYTKMYFCIGIFYKNVINPIFDRNFQFIHNYFSKQQLCTS